MDIFSFDNKPKIPFKLCQVYEEPKDTLQVKCNTCGETKLEVGVGSYFTIVRCSNCLHEECIHEG